MVEELQLTFKGYHQLNEMSPGHESTISTNFEKSDETLHIHIYTFFVPLFSPPLSSPSSPPRAIKPFPRAEAKYIVKKERAAAWMKASWNLLPRFLPKQIIPSLWRTLWGREREREKKLHLRFLPPLPRPGRHREHVVDRWKISRRPVVDEAANRTISYFRPIRSPRPSLVHTLSYWYISFRFFLSSFLRARYRVRGGKRKEGREREREGRIGAVSRESQTV